MKKALVCLLSLCFLGGTSIPVYATILNGGFESIDSHQDNPISTRDLANFSNWERIGNVYETGAYFNEENTEGATAALLSTSDYANGFGDHQLESFLGLSSGTIDSIATADALVGSALKQTFTAEAGDVLSFDWKFFSHSGASESENDVCFLTLDQDIYLLIDRNTGISNGLFEAFPELPVLWQTDFFSYTQTLTSTGSHTLGLGVVDVGSLYLDSWLVVDNVQVGAEPVPEPATMLLLGSGLVGLAGFRRKFRNG